ncbi:SDR family oxidoreductase [Pseudoxanthobacter sp.]|uniref:SDR family oxidoreductase n=1 Tax=Pseudoxanthobacter sp. TaxID=1925742 RepID=UPI002FE4074E
MKSDRRVALVTAAGSGIGAGAARRLAADGWQVVLFGRSQAVETLAAQTGGHAIRGDIARPDDLARLVRETVETFGRIDGAVVSTGHTAHGDLIALTDEDWHAGLDMLLMPVVRLSRLLVPLFLKAGHGSVVAVSSFAAVEPDPDFPVSSALRAALSSYVKLLARRYAADGIRVNSVLPGFIDSFPERDDRVARIPAGRYGRVEELAATIAFLLSDDAGYVTGQNIAVEGGLLGSL